MNGAVCYKAHVLQVLSDCSRRKKIKHPRVAHWRASMATLNPPSIFRSDCGSLMNESSQEQRPARIQLDRVCSLLPSDSIGEQRDDTIGGSGAKERRDDAARLDASSKHLR